MASIIGITGTIGSGKTTLSNILAELEPEHAIYESGLIIAELADEFNKALTEQMSFELTQNNAELVNQTLVWFTESLNEKLHHNTTWNHLAITKHRLAAHSNQYTKLFEYLATVKKDPAVATRPITPENKATYRPLLQWLGGYLVMTVSKTLWFDEIFRRIRANDNKTKLIIINGLRFPTDADVVRAQGGHIIEITRPLKVQDPTDPTEASRNLIKPDITIKNDGTLKQLQALTALLHADLLAGTLHKDYTIKAIS